MSGASSVTHAKHLYLTETGAQDRKSVWAQADDPLRGRSMCVALHAQ
eukprot:gene2157-biopygen11321